MEQELGDGWAEGVHPDDLDFCLSTYLAAFDARLPFEMEYRLRDQQGKYRWIDDCGKPLHDLEGNFAGYIGTCFDTTERKRAEEELRQSEARFRQFAENIDGALWITDHDEHRVLYLSPGYEQIWGRTCESVYEDPTAWMDAIHPDDRDRIRNVAMTPRIFDGYDEEFRIIRPDGSVRWIRDRAFPVKDGSGRVHRATGVAEDITERKRADDSLLRLAAIAEQSSDAIIGKTLRGIVTNWNKGAERIYGYTAEEIVGHSISVLVPPENHNDVPQILERIARGEQVEHYETVRVRKDGQRIHISLSVSPIMDATGKIVGASAIARDVSERRRADEKLRATTEQLRALSARLQAAREAEGMRISREIHDELGAALSSLKWDLEEIDETILHLRDASQLEALEPKVKAMMSLADTTISTVRRIASELRPIVLDTLGLIEAVECQAAQFRDRTGIIVRCDWAVEKVDLDREQATNAFRIFQEALTNILRHAQATKVIIQMKQEGSEFILTITDNGRGVTQAEAAGNHSLGLLGMQERAHLIGGTLCIAGSDGFGTAITLRIPVRPVMSQRAP